MCSGPYDVVIQVVSCMFIVVFTFYHMAPSQFLLFGSWMILDPLMPISQLKLPVTEGSWHGCGPKRLWVDLGAGLSDSLPCCVVVTVTVTVDVLVARARVTEVSDSIPFHIESTNRLIDLYFLNLIYHQAFSILNSSDG
jgi:hypothetical protein